MKKSIVIILLIQLVSCKYSTDRSYVTKQLWQHDSGAKPFGNFLDFNYYSLRNDTVFLKGMPLGRIIEEKRLSDELIVYSFLEKKNGIYINSAQFTE